MMLPVPVPGLTFEAPSSRSEPATTTHATATTPNPAVTAPATRTSRRRTAAAIAGRPATRAQAATVTSINAGDNPRVDSKTTADTAAQMTVDLAGTPAGAVAQWSNVPHSAIADATS